MTTLVGNKPGKATYDAALHWWGTGIGIIGNFAVPNLFNAPRLTCRMWCDTGNESLAKVGMETFVERKDA